jgi:hypothetical protein
VGVIAYLGGSSRRVVVPTIVVDRLLHATDDRDTESGNHS